MEYKINKTNYHTFEVFQVNKLPGRSYFIPYQNRDLEKDVPIKEKRYKSDKVICLNGDWDFKFYLDPKQLPDTLNTDEVKFDKIDGTEGEYAEFPFPIEVEGDIDYYVDKYL